MLATTACCPAADRPIRLTVGMLNMLYSTSALILVRYLFRIIEYITGADAYPPWYGRTPYTFDALLMVIIMVIFCWWYPSNIRQSKEMWRDSSIGMVDR